MTKLYYEFVTGDPDFRAEMEGATYPNGFAGFNREKVVFGYEHQLLIWPWWGPSRGDAATTPWFSSGIGTVPPGNVVQMRGLYEIEAFGLENWREQVIVPNIQAWVANRIAAGYFSNAATFQGQISIDFETWGLFSFESGSGAYNYWKSATGTSGAVARAKWEKLVVGLWSLIMAELRRVFPKAKFSNLYITGEYLYQMDDSPGAPGTQVVETGQTVKAALQYQARGPTPPTPLPSFQGGKAGWLLQVFKMFDYVEAELYAKVGVSTPNGGSVEIGSESFAGGSGDPDFFFFNRNEGSVPEAAQGWQITSKMSAESFEAPPEQDPPPPSGTETINSVSRRDAAFYYRLHCEEMRRIAAAAQRPLRLWLHPKYAIFNLGTLLPKIGLNDLDAELLVEEMKSVGANIGIWMWAPANDEVEKQGIRDGLRQLNPFLRRLYSL